MSAAGAPEICKKKKKDSCDFSQEFCVFFYDFVDFNRNSKIDCIKNNILGCWRASNL